MKEARIEVLASGCVCYAAEPVIRIASMGTEKIAESATRLSTVGRDSPCCHL